MVDASCRDVGSEMGGLVEIAVGCSVNGPLGVGGDAVPLDAARGLFKETLLPSFCVGNSSFEEPPWLSDEIALLSAMHFGLAAAKSPHTIGRRHNPPCCIKMGERPKEKFL